MRRGFVTVAAGAVAAVLSAGVFVVDAPRAGADGLLGYDLSSDARGVQVFTDIPDQRVEPEFDLPQASTTLQSGTGYALASNLWPGAGVANGGTLLPLLIPGFPQEVANRLAYPVRAEARTGQDPPVTTYDLPGTTMRARADGQSAEGDAGAQGVSLLPGAFGTITTSASSRATSNAAVSTARSVVHNLNVAGVLEIDQVVSTAKATSDGTKASGEQHTIISGATVAGQGVTIDENGLHFGSSNQPVDAVVQQIAKQALDAAGIKVTVGPATHEITGAGAVVGANSVVITLTQNGYTLGLVLGGARATAVASGGDEEILGDVGGGTGAEVLGDSSGGGFDGLTGGGSDLSGLGTLPNNDGNGGGRGPAVDLTPKTVAATGKPVSRAALILGVLATLLLSVGMRRLFTSVIADPTATIACTLPGEERL
ncbi:MAG: hypothetical protein QOG90_2599 [Actinomycetota bacterium]|jgi:hypothetical protein